MFLKIRLYRKATLPCVFVRTQGGGQSWSIGGFVKKFLPKGKNEMILPDDNNPTIVWDPDKQRWVNTDGDDEEEEKNKAPPPKDSDLMGEFIYLIHPTSAAALVTI